jgi:hypothetical protein
MPPEHEVAGSNPAWRAIVNKRLTDRKEDAEKAVGNVLETMA